TCDLSFICPLFLHIWNIFCDILCKSIIMKRIILFIAIVFGFAGVTLAQTTEKVKTKIESQGFKKKTKSEGEPQRVLTSVSAHPAYTHHYRTVHRYTTAKRHTAYTKRHVTHKR